MTMYELKILEAYEAYDKVINLLMKEGMTDKEARKQLETIVFFMTGRPFFQEEHNLDLAKFIEGVLKGDKPQC